MSTRSWIITADFETRSRIDLKKVGAWRYSVDPSTEALCLGYAIDSGERRLWKRGEPAPEDLFEALRRGALLEAHNVFFEWCIWHNVMCARHGWPSLHPRRVTCTAARAAVACLPRALENALPAAGLEVTKTDKKAMLKLAKPRRPTKHDSRVWHDEPHLFEELYNYCLDDVKAEQALSGALPALSAFERRVFLADFNINLRGLRVDVAFVQAALAVSQFVERELSGELMKATRGEVMAATERDRIVDYLGSIGLPMHALTQESVEDMLLTATPTAQQRRILEIRQEGSRSSVSKYQAFLDCLDGDAVRGLYVYYGANAHGRWSGRLVQPQNFPRGNAKCADESLKGGAAMEAMVSAIKHVAKNGNTAHLRRHFRVEQLVVPGDPKSGRRLIPASPAEVLSTALRGAFVARPGRAFGVGDYSAIEARALFWLAEEEHGLQIYAENGDVYRDMGSVIFDKPPEELDLSFERMMGKTTVLGCGYGMAWIKFQRTCKRAYGLNISDDLCKRSVHSYRRRYAKVPAFWRALERAARMAIRNGPNGPTVSISQGRIQFFMDRKNLAVVLPSGREIYHRRAWISDDDQICYIDGKGFRQTTYGGKICEYVVSGTARDLLADALVRAEFDYPGVEPVMHSHDEIVCEGDPDTIEQTVGRLMGESPAWAAGLPIKVDTWSGTRYHK